MELMTLKVRLEIKDDMIRQVFTRIVSSEEGFSTYGPGDSGAADLLILHLGERPEEVLGVMEDLRGVGCDILTLGQYLRPTAAHLPVERYVAPAEFEALGGQALRAGFRHVESGPLVRSSYHAWRHVP